MEVDTTTYLSIRKVLKVTKIQCFLDVSCLKIGLYSGRNAACLVSNSAKTFAYQILKGEC